MNIKRAYYIFKSRTHVRISHLIERVLKTLSKWGLIVEHKKDRTYLHDQGDIHTAPDINSERFSFSVSYIIRKIEFTSQYWFETKRGKRIYTVYDNHHEENRVSYRAELKSFFAHFSHKHRMWVHRETPRIVIHKIPSICTSWLEPEMIKYEEHTCDFSKCRYALEFSLAPDTMPLTSDEVISKSYKVLGDSLMSKVVEMNEMLTGVKNDGEMTSPSNCLLADNLICRRCGFPVFNTNEGMYVYECIHHGNIERQYIDKVDPKTYEVVLSNCLTELERFCECPQD